MQIDERLLQPAREQARALARARAVEQAVQRRRLARTRAEHRVLWRGEEAERAHAGRVKAHVLREVVPAQRVLAVVGVVRDEREVRGERGRRLHRELQVELGCACA